jgi:hypothetical protein
LNLVLKRKKLSSLRELSKTIQINYSTLKNYSQEKRLMPRDLVKSLCRMSNIPFSSLSITELKPENWGKIKGGSIGIRSLMKRYPHKLIEWRRKGDKRGRLKKIKIPSLNEDLAEFIGVYLGDGTITRYFIRISGDGRYDISYFNYLSKKIYDLFNVKTSTIKEKRGNSCYLLISSKEICNFLREEYSLEYGNKIKNKTIIPKQILINKKLSLACLRGLVDTDGSVSRRGNQFCVQFASHNPNLLNQVNDLGKKYGVFTYFSGNETGTNKWGNVVRYFHIVGSSNLKHIIRFHLKYSKNKAVYIREISKYLKKSLYREMDLPFKMGP